MCIASTVTKWNASRISTDSFVWLCCGAPPPLVEFSFREPSVELDRQLMKPSEMFTAHITNHWGPDCSFSKVLLGAGRESRLPLSSLLMQKHSHRKKDREPG